MATEGHEDASAAATAAAAASECQGLLAGEDKPDTGNGYTALTLQACKADDDEVLVIRRQLYTQHDLDQAYQDQREPSSPCQVLRKHCQCSPRCVGRTALSFLPVLRVLRKYNWRQSALADLIAGLSVGFIHLPQGLGFGLLASLQPVNGLYTTFFPTLLYILFGTSPHVSMGTNAVIALLTANLVNREADAYQASFGSNSTLSPEEIMHYKVSIASVSAFVAGVILLGMGILRLGFITNYLAKSFIGGFTFAAAVHITTSQIVKMLHLSFRAQSGAGSLVKTYIEIFRNITHSNPGDIIVGLICMAVLLAVKIGINERFKHRMKIPVPIELIVVILSTLISHFAKFKERFGIAIVGDVPTGMPAPSIPPMEHLPQVGVEAFVTAILCFALTIALGKLCAKLHSIELDDNQELVSYGLCNLFGSFFQNFPSCTAPPRTMMLSSLGAKSTLNGVTSAVFILLVLLVVGQLFVSLPIAMLAAMIIVAMKDLLMQIRNTKSLWYVNKPDFFIWVLTASVSVLVGLDIGLLAGVLFSLLTILLVSQLAPATLLGRAETEDVLLDRKRDGIKLVPGIRIFRFESQLYFASAERFKTKLYSTVFDPTKIKRSEVTVKNAAPAIDPLVVVNSEKKSLDGVANLPDGKLSTDGIHHVILDCSAMTYIDLAGIDMLQMVMTRFAKSGVVVFLTCIPPRTMATLHRARFFDTCDRQQVFYNIFDALHKACEPESIVAKL
ncbi:sulfate transporter-like isoform X2 [Pomacea canaliculata]|uniref:sulfate transporter-like isoform X2 n=1 Tax=Pomacea canaliculata TaxID=400727 RepID=UPI000D739195|nr:sulfate transporter-like isoform X2 [Pomacea canaliculata]